MSRILPLCLVCLALAGCDVDVTVNGQNWGVGSARETVKGSGVVATEVRPVEPFTAISLLGPGHVVIERTGTESVTVMADDNLLPLIKSEVRGGTLFLSVADGKSVSA